MELWEDELLLDDDFSDEEEDAEEQIEKTSLEMDADDFADWEDSSDGAPEDETLEEALAEERTLELESELEQIRDFWFIKSILSRCSRRSFLRARSA